MTENKDAIQGTGIIEEKIDPQDVMTENQGVMVENQGEMIENQGEMIEIPDATTEIGTIEGKTVEDFLIVGDFLTVVQHATKETIEERSDPQDATTGVGTGIKIENQGAMTEDSKTENPGGKKERETPGGKKETENLEGKKETLGAKRETGIPEGKKETGTREGKKETGNLDVMIEKTAVEISEETSLLITRDRTQIPRRKET